MTLCTKKVECLKCRLRAAAPRETHTYNNPEILSPQDWVRLCNIVLDEQGPLSLCKWVHHEGEERVELPQEILNYPVNMIGPTEQELKRLLIPDYPERGDIWKHTGLHNDGDGVHTCGCGFAVVVPNWEPITKLHAINQMHVTLYPDCIINQITVKTILYESCYHYMLQRHFRFGDDVDMDDFYERADAVLMIRYNKETKNYEELADDQFRISVKAERRLHWRPSLFL